MFDLISGAILILLILSVMLGLYRKDGYRRFIRWSLFLLFAGLITFIFLFSEEQENSELFSAKIDAYPAPATLKVQEKKLYVLNSLSNALDTTNSLLAEREASLRHLEAEIRVLAQNNVRAQDIIDSLNQLSRVETKLIDTLIIRLTDTLSGYHVDRRGEKIIITDDDDVTFETGRADVTIEGRESLQRMAKQVLSVIDTSRNFVLRIEGHTDTIPIRTTSTIELASYDQKYSNWELSALRALSVARFFRDSTGIAASRIEPIAMGPYHPIRQGESARSRRRVVLVLDPIGY